MILQPIPSDFSHIRLVFFFISVMISVLLYCIGPEGGYDIAVVKINETQLTNADNLSNLRQCFSSIILHRHSLDAVAIWPKVLYFHRKVQKVTEPF